MKKVPWSGGFTKMVAYGKLPTAKWWGTTRAEKKPLYRHRDRVVQPPGHKGEKSKGKMRRKKKKRITNLGWFKP